MKYILLIVGETSISYYHPSDEVEKNALVGKLIQCEKLVRMGEYNFDSKGRGLDTTITVLGEPSKFKKTGGKQLWQN